MLDWIEGMTKFVPNDKPDRGRLSEFYFTGINKGRQTSLERRNQTDSWKIVNDAMIRKHELSVKKFLSKRLPKHSCQNLSGNRHTKQRHGLGANRCWLKGQVDQPNCFEGNDAIDDYKLKKQTLKTYEHPSGFTLHRVLLSISKPPSLRKTLEPTNSKPMSWREVKGFIW